MQESTTKKCTKCDETKTLDCFHKNKSTKDGLAGYCKLCRKPYSHTEKSKSCQKEYRASEKGKAYQKNYYYSGVGKTRQQLYRDSERGKATKKAYKHLYPQKITAQNGLNYAVAVGRIIKPNDCADCGSISNKLDGHHKDYAKPLEVRWLCRQCHRVEHAKNGPGLNGT